MLDNRLQIIEIAKKDCQRFSKNYLETVKAIAECRADTLANNVEDYSFIYFTYMYEYLLNTSSLADLKDAGDKAAKLLREHIEGVSVNNIADNKVVDDLIVDDQPDPYTENSTQETDL